MLFILVVIVVLFVLPVVVLLLTVAGSVYSIFRALGGRKGRAPRPVGSGPLVAQPHKAGVSQGSRHV
jgi:hypothetical protein